MFFTIGARRFGVPVADLAWKKSDDHPGFCVSGVQVSLSAHYLATHHVLPLISSYQRLWSLTFEQIRADLAGRNAKLHSPRRYVHQEPLCRPVVRIRQGGFGSGRIGRSYGYPLDLIVFLPIPLSIFPLSSTRFCVPFGYSFWDAWVTFVHPDRRCFRHTSCETWGRDLKLQGVNIDCWCLSSFHLCLSTITFIWQEDRITTFS